MYDGKTDILYGNGLVKLQNESFIKSIQIIFNIDGDYDINDRGGLLYYNQKIGGTYKASIFVINNKILDGTIIRYTGNINILSAKINNKFRIAPSNSSYKNYTDIKSSTGTIFRLDDSIANIGAIVEMGDNSKTIKEYKLNAFSSKRWPSYRKTNLGRARQSSLVTGRIMQPNYTNINIKNVKPKTKKQNNLNKAAKVSRNLTTKKKKQVAKRKMAAATGSKRSKY